MKANKLETLGYIGAGFIILSYVLASLNIINSNQIIYYLAVGIGCGTQCVYCMARKVMPQFYVNFIIFSFSMVGLVRLIFFH